jgi:hypothetical protein
MIDAGTLEVVGWASQDAIHRNQDCSWETVRPIQLSHSCSPLRSTPRRPVSTASSARDEITGVRQWRRLIPSDLESERHKGDQMATWNDVRKYLQANYKVQEDDSGKMIRLLFNTGNGRSHQVVVTSGGNNGTGEMASIYAPIGQIKKVELKKVCEEVFDNVLGGICILNDLVLYKHAVPLENLDANELTVPLEFICGIADKLEQEFTGGDNF